MKTVVIQSQQRWEYMCATRRSETALLDEMNEFGQQGWELVTVQFYKDGKGVAICTAYFKRPSPGPPTKPAETTEMESSIGVGSLGNSTVNHPSGILSGVGQKRNPKAVKEVRVSDLPEE